MDEQTPAVPDVPAAETPEVEAPAVETPAEPELTAAEKKLMEKVEKLAKENKNLIRKQQVMADNTKFIIESSVKQRIAELQAQKDVAIDEGDRQKVRAIESQIDEVRTETAKVTAPIQPTLDPAIQEFVDANEWFNKDDEMTQFAIAMNESLLKKPGMTLEKSLEETLAKVKKAYPDKFEAEKKEDKPAPPSPVDGTSRQNSGNKYSMSRLSEEQKIAYEQFVRRNKIMTHEAYFKSLEEAGYLA